MRVLVAALTFAIAAAGCTTGDLPLTGAPTTQDPATLWAPAASSHPGRVSVTATLLTLGGDLRHERDEMQLDAHGFGFYALANVTHEGARGWVRLDPGTTIEGAIVLDGGFRVSATGVSATLSPELGGVPLAPPPLDGQVISRFHGVTFLAQATLRGPAATFYAQDGNATPLASGAVVGLTGAALTGPMGDTGFGPLVIELGPSARVHWNGSLDLVANQPQGTVTLGGTGHAISGPSLSVRMLGNETLALTAGTSLDVAGEMVSILDGPRFEARLGATLRLAPNALNATGPAGNVTRVKMVLAETSGGADAHITGFRVTGTTSRYVGSEPFAITYDLLRTLRETEGPMTPAVVLALGITLPFVTLLEGFTAFAQAIFPPSIAGPLHANQARIVTFELLMPAQATDAEILIEAKNAAPVFATVRLTPT